LIKSGPPDLYIPQRFPRLEEEKIPTIHHEDANLLPDIYTYDPCYDVYLKSLPLLPAESEPFGDLSVSRLTEGQSTTTIEEGNRSPHTVENTLPPHLPTGDFTIDYSFANDREAALLANTPTIEQSQESQEKPFDPTDRDPPSMSLCIFYIPTLMSLQTCLGAWVLLLCLNWWLWKR
jgi:hypothetical protein